ncbi:MAG: hypothetical protein AVDCRST_MAG66-3023, partial [uncultured Pseudonocardia sp.]
APPPHDRWCTRSYRGDTSPRVVETGITVGRGVDRTRTGVPRTL